MPDRFSGRTLVIATMHRKETVIAPLLEKKLGVSCITAEGLDTDQWGTFSGEKERTETPLNTAREKCLRAIALTGCELAVASEGSFGPHPFLPFVPAGEELLLFMDKRIGMEIQVRHLSTSVNYAGEELRTEYELLEFARKVSFPEQGLILRRAKGDLSGLVKGIREEQVLLDTFRHLLGESGSVYAETDMRAMHNPARMQEIEKAALKLVEKIQSVCPNCHMPGFSVEDVVPGLPCGICRSPTRSTLAHIYRCLYCACQRTVRFPNGKRVEDPMYCDQCNP